MILYRRNSKIFILFFLLLTGYLARTQTRFAVFAGPQATTSSYSVRSIKQSTNFKPGFLLGLSAKIEFDKNLYFAPSIFYSFKGYKVALSDTAYPPGYDIVRNDIHVHSLELAPMLEYDLSSLPSHFFIRLGPSFEIQVYGREKVTFTDGMTDSRDMKYGFAAYGRYDASAILQFGYEFKKVYFVQAFYSHGLSDLNNADLGPSIKYRTAGIAMGMYFK